MFSTCFDTDALFSLECVFIPVTEPTTGVQTVDIVVVRSGDTSISGTVGK